MLQGKLRYWLKAYPNTIPAIEAFFKFPPRSEDISHKLAKSTPQKMADFFPKKGRILITRLKIQNRLDGGN